jgi:hypothetical protein
LNVFELNGFELEDLQLKDLQLKDLAFYLPPRGYRPASSQENNIKAASDVRCGEINFPHDRRDRRAVLACQMPEGWAASAHGSAGKSGRSMQDMN